MQEQHVKEEVQEESKETEKYYRYQKLFRSYQWKEMPQKQEFLQKLLAAFGKDESYLDRLDKRFSDAQVDLFYPDGINGWVGACVHWQEYGYRYLDKFFVVEKGWGRAMLNCFLRGDRRIVWRTSPSLAKRFYGKHPLVYTIYQKGEYVYQTTSYPHPNSLPEIREVEGAFISR